VLVGRQVSQKGFDLRPAHVVRMAFVVEEDEAFDPEDVTLLGAVGIVLEANGVAYLIEEFFGTSRVGRWSY